MNNREQIEQSVISASAYNGNDTEGLLKEIEDVYKKAQAFDEILEGMTNAIQHSVKEGVELDEAVGIMQVKLSINMRRNRKMSISVGDKVFNPETNSTLEIVQLVGDIRDTHYKLSDGSIISLIDFVVKPIHLIKEEQEND